ncbi:MAG TPA: winged helix-turn-helix domain-containing protein [Gemmatimonadales bacterium]|nr:winged helix-turn-helix domain-containing protein [Gemmatimonadales bacterium]
MRQSPVADLLATLNEPTRLRILNSVSRVPLSVPDLAAILTLPETAVSDAIDALQGLRIVRAFTVVPHVLYTLVPLAAHHERLLRAALDAVRSDPAAQRDRAAARQRSRARLDTRARPALMDAT